MRPGPSSGRRANKRAARRPPGARPLSHACRLVAGGHGRHFELIIGRLSGSQVVEQRQKQTEKQRQQQQQKQKPEKKQKQRRVGRAAASCVRGERASSATSESLSSEEDSRKWRMAPLIGQQARPNQQCRQQQQRRTERPLGCQRSESDEAEPEFSSSEQLTLNRAAPEAGGAKPASLMQQLLLMSPGHKWWPQERPPAAAPAPPPAGSLGRLLARVSVPLAATSLLLFTLLCLALSARGPLAHSMELGVAGPAQALEAPGRPAEPERQPDEERLLEQSLLTQLLANYRQANLRGAQKRLSAGKRHSAAQLVTETETEMEMETETETETEPETEAAAEPPQQVEAGGQPRPSSLRAGPPLELELAAPHAQQGRRPGARARPAQPADELAARHRHHQPQQQPRQQQQLARHQLQQMQPAELAKGERAFDVAQIQCNNTDEGFERFACPTPDELGRYRCIEDRLFCDGYYDCPNREDEHGISCMYYKLFVSHIDILTNTFLTWKKKQNRQQAHRSELAFA